MATVIAETRYTPNDLLTLEEGDRYELIDGQLVEKPMGAKASRVALKLMARLNQYAETQGGLAFDAECGYQILVEHPNRVRKPDGSFILSGRLPDDEPPEGHIRIAPDLAVEVVSPNDVACELDLKIEDYLKAGVRLIWVVYPSTRRVMVYRPGGRVSRLTTADELQGEDVLPGFVCRVEDLFSGLRSGATG